MKQGRRQSLSVCMIVKNEEDMLTDCLQSVVEIADQLVILDTGSSDKTLEIAKTFRADIHHFNWCNDFSAARNESIKYATGDWILWLDADERLESESRSKILGLLRLELKPVIYRVRIKNLKEDGVNYTLSDAHRLFTNHRRIKFSGRIHEQISPSAERLGAEERDCGIVLNHLGYSFTGQEKADKQSRNRTILEEEVRKYPNNAHNHYTLAHNYKTDGRLEDAERHYQKAIELKQFDPPMEASLLNAYADTMLDLDRPDDSIPLIKRSLQLRSLQNAAYFLEYRLAVLKNQWPEAILALQQIQSQREQIHRQGTGISTDIEISEATVWQTLAELFTRQEKWGKATEAYELCLKASKGSVKMYRNYFKVLEKQQSWMRSLDVLTELIKLEGELPVYLNAISAIFIRLGEYDAAIQTLLRLNHLHPDNLDVRKKIASLYTKTGRIEEAQEWL